MAEVTTIAKNPEDVFPLNVWEHIFDKLETPTDMAACFRTCGAFRKLLESKRTLFLMQEVLPFLCDYLPKETKTNNDNDKDATSNSDDDDESVAARNRLSQIKLVCKFWKSGVNSYLEDVKKRNDYSHSPDRQEFVSVMDRICAAAKMTDNIYHCVSQL